MSESTGCICPICQKEVAVGDVLNTSAIKRLESQPDLLEACKLLAELFPEELDQLDAADFKDRAAQLMGCVLLAKDAIAKASL